MNQDIDNELVTADQLKTQFQQIISQKEFDKLDMFITNQYISFPALAMYFLSNGILDGTRYLLDNYLEEMCKVTHQDQTLIFWTIQWQNMDSLKILMEYPDMAKQRDTSSLFSYSPLHTSLTHGNKEMSRYLAETFPDMVSESHPDSQDTVAHLMVFLSDPDMTKTMDYVSLELWNQKNKRGWTPLHLAVIQNNLEMVTQLVEIGVDTSVLDNKSNTALELASQMDHNEIVDYLEKNVKIGIFENITI